MVYHGEYLLASQLRIPFEEMLIDTWVGHMYRLDTRLAVAIAFMKTQPVGGYHE